MKLHVDYMRSMDDSQRAREACVTYLQNCLVLLHPERPDLVMLAQELASELGGRLEIPRLSWKYAWINEIFGWQVARVMERNLQAMRWWLMRNWDRMPVRFR
jgi:hypothetical protein